MGLSPPSHFSYRAKGLDLAAVSSPEESINQGWAGQYGRAPPGGSREPGSVGSGARGWGLHR